MQLTRHTDYSLRVLMYLASHDNELVSISRLSDAYKVSNNHMVKVVHNLVKIGYLKSVRGRNGGVQLTHSPEKILIGNAIQDIENQPKIINCSSINCILEKQCILENTLISAQKTFYQQLNKTSLADISSNKNELRSLLKKA